MGPHTPEHVKVYVLTKEPVTVVIGIYLDEGKARQEADFFSTDGHTYAVSEHELIT